MEDYNNYNPSLTRLLLHKQPIKIYHQNIRSLRYKMNEILCHLNHDPPHILCISEHHLHHEELASFHIENYVLGSCYCRKSKQKGGVCIFVHNSRKFTSLDLDNLDLVRKSGPQYGGERNSNPRRWYIGALRVTYGK